MTRSTSVHPAISVAVVLAYVAVACVCAVWAAGAIFYLMHKAPLHGVTPWTWFTYAHFYWHDGKERKLLMLAMLVPGLLALFLLSPLFSVLAGRERDLHGAARFATADEVRRAGLMGDKGIIVGKQGNRYLQFPGQQFCLLAAPTRSGKGVSFVIPNLLNWPDSCVVLDIKLENFLLTSKFRGDHGQKVFLFNPFAEDAQTHRWNPLDGISRDPNFRIGDIQALASTIYPAQPGDRDAFWADSAKNLFLGLVLLLIETENAPVTLGEVLRQSGGKGKPLKEHLADTINERIRAEKPLSADCVDALNRFLSASENTLANITSTFTAPLVLFANPLLDAATSVSDFDLAEVRDQRMTIYVGIQPNRLAEAALLINVLFSQLINLNTKTMPSDNRHPIPCLLILDELPALGRISVLAKANAYIAGYNLRLLTIIQSVAQLEAVYGPNDARTLITNHAMQVLFTPREQRDAATYSEVLGTYTVKSTSKGISNNRGFGAGGSSSEHVSDQKRPLLMAQELKELPDGEQIILLENSKPIRCRKAKFFQDKVFLGRLSGALADTSVQKALADKKVLDELAFEKRALAIAVPTLDIDGHVARVQGRLRTLGESEAIDLARLEMDLSELPEFDDPENPSDASVNEVVDGFFRLAGEDVGDGDKPVPAQQQLETLEA